MKCVYLLILMAIYVYNVALWRINNNVSNANTIMCHMANEKMAILMKIYWRNMYEIQYNDGVCLLLQ